MSRETVSHWNHFVVVGKVMAKNGERLRWNGSRLGRIAQLRFSSPGKSSARSGRQSNERHGQVREPAHQRPRATTKKRAGASESRERTRRRIQVDYGQANVTLRTGNVDLRPLLPLLPLLPWLLPWPVWLPWLPWPPAPIVPTAAPPPAAVSCFTSPEVLPAPLMVAPVDGLTSPSEFTAASPLPLPPLGFVSPPSVLECSTPWEEARDPAPPVGWPGMARAGQEACKDERKAKN